MDNIINIYHWFVENKENLVSIVAHTVALASIVVKLTPTLKDDTVLKNIVKFIGKYIALNR